MPLLAVEVLEPAVLEAMPGFRERLEWYLTNRPDLASLISRVGTNRGAEIVALSLSRAGTG